VFGSSGEYITIRMLTRVAGAAKHFIKLYHFISQQSLEFISNQGI